MKKTVLFDQPLTKRWIEQAHQFFFDSYKTVDGLDGYLLIVKVQPLEIFWHIISEILSDFLIQS